ncbi:hypothetical protein K438DRAFT_1750308 [Mycena galopus ATCC 62051]|nr:hypothetical protein K438DRAFT_1750308 [Mycena galopus ATCC 62051]
MCPNQEIFRRAFGSDISYGESRFLHLWLKNKCPHRGTHSKASYFKKLEVKSTVDSLEFTVDASDPDGSLRDLSHMSHGQDQGVWPEPQLNLHSYRIFSEVSAIETNTYHIPERSPDDGVQLPLVSAISEPQIDDLIDIWMMLISLFELQQQVLAGVMLAVLQTGGTLRIQMPWLGIFLSFSFPTPFLAQRVPSEFHLEALGHRRQPIEGQLPEKYLNVSVAAASSRVPGVTVV